MMGYVVGADLHISVTFAHDNHVEALLILWQVHQNGDEGE